MALNIVPFEQSFGTLVAGIVCTAGSGGVAATIIKKANTVNAVAAGLADLGSGNIVAASGAILAAINNDPNLDPAVALALNNIFQIAVMQWQAQQAITALVPFLSTTAEALISNFATGLAAGATAELTKYAPPPAPAPAA